MSVKVSLGWRIVGGDYLITCAAESSEMSRGWSFSPKTQTSCRVGFRQSSLQKEKDENSNTLAQIFSALNAGKCLEKKNPVENQFKSITARLRQKSRLIFFFFLYAPAKPPIQDGFAHLAPEAISMHL